MSASIQAHSQVAISDKDADVRLLEDERRPGQHFEMVRQRHERCWNDNRRQKSVETEEAEEQEQRKDVTAAC